MNRFLDNRIILFGLTGYMKNVLNIFCEFGFYEQIKFICDNNPIKQGKKYEGFDVFPASKIFEETEALIVICSFKFEEIYKQLQKMEVKNTIYMIPFLSVESLSEINDAKIFFKQHEKELYDIYNNTDFYTKFLLKKLIDTRKQENSYFVQVESFLGFSEVSDYFYESEYQMLDAITFIDGGAYIGDSVQKNFKTFGEKVLKIYAFEPEKYNFNILKQYIRNERLSNKVQCYQAGLGSKKEILTFYGSGLGGKVDKLGDTTIEMLTIDDTIKQPCKSLLIKLDVEGFEQEALQGARKTIENHHPYLAVCLYHKYMDILTIPTFIRSINDAYDFVLRAGVHTECYAIPKK